MYNEKETTLKMRTRQREKQISTMQNATRTSLSPSRVAVCQRQLCCLLSMPVGRHEHPAIGQYLRRQTRLYLATPNVDRHNVREEPLCSKCGAGNAPPLETLHRTMRALSHWLAGEHTCAGRPAWRHHDASAEVPTQIE